MTPPGVFILIYLLYHINIFFEILVIYKILSRSSGSFEESLKTHERRITHYFESLLPGPVYAIDGVRAFGGAEWEIRVLATF